MSRDRINAFKRVLAGYRRDGVPDEYLAGIAADLNGSVDPAELDRAIAADIVAGVAVALAAIGAETSEAAGPTACGP